MRTKIAIVAALLLATWLPAIGLAQNTCEANWCMAGVTIKASGVDVTTVAPGGTITITVAFQNTSSTAQPVVTLGVSIYDPTKTQLTGSGVWLPGNNFAPGQTIVTTFDFIAPATPGTYTIAAGTWVPDGSNPLWDGAAQTFLVTAPVAAAPLPPPPCYALGAVNLTVTLNPPSWADWLLASNPYFVITWFCPSDTDPRGYVGYGITGYRSELLPNWSSLINADKATLDSLWIQQAAVANDQELQPASQAQLAATRPRLLQTIDTTVYYVIQQPDKYVAVAVGTVPLGTACIRSQSVDGMYGVPVGSVTWFGNVKPQAVVAQCG